MNFKEKWLKKSNASFAFNSHINPNNVENVTSFSVNIAKFKLLRDPLVMSKVSVTLMHFNIIKIFTNKSDNKSRKN